MGVWKQAVLAVLWFPIVLGKYSDTFDVQIQDGCTTLIHKFNPLIHKQKYTVGVYSSEGEEQVFRVYGKTFAEYLTATAGRRFDPPIQFDITAVSLTELAQKGEKETVDFMFGSSAVSSCMIAEQFAEPLVTIVNRRRARGHTYELDVYGGVIFTLANNTRVNTIEDLKDKTIGAGGITAMGGGQSQYYEMFRHGLSYVADPAQVVFTDDERLIVEGVMNKEFEVGFARTDQIERHRGPDEELIDPDVFKVINQRMHILEDGTLFPFLSSTDLHPEWPVAALRHVSRDVSKEVQSALLALRDHATSLTLNTNLRCDTTPETAELALAASESGHYAGFRTAMSYGLVRTKQEAAGLMRKAEDGSPTCIRGDTLYDDIFCPEGQYKQTKEEFEAACDNAGLSCREEYNCYCKPCIKAYEVEVFQVQRGEKSDQLNETTVHQDGCDKMSVCGTTPQTKPIVFNILDNRERDGAHVEVLVHMNEQTISPKINRREKPYMYQISWTQDRTGIDIMEVFFDGEQIPQSPFRVLIADRQCELDFPGQKRSPTANGDCECSGGSMEISGRCIESTIMAVCISLLAVLVVTLVGYYYTLYKTQKNDEMWKVDLDEIQFSDPVEIIGQGSFGVVILGEYRGTKVALKRALKVNAKGSKHGSKRHPNSGSRSHGTTVGSNGADTSNDSVEVVSIDTNGRSPDLESADGDSRASPEQEKNHSSFNEYSLGFLNDNFGVQSKWARLFASRKKDDYRSRFKEAILGGSGSGGLPSLGKSRHAALCPWFSAHAKAEKAFMVEMRVLSRLRHPNITTVLGAVVSRSRDPMLVMEYMEYGSLYDLLQNETIHLSGEIILQVSRDIAQGLRFLHSSKPPILHGDLKARNILIDSRFRAKLCDFGLSTKEANNITGTPLWLAPEYLRGQTPYTTNCDVYSMGILFYEIYAREPPYKGEDYRDTLRKVCDRRVNKRPPVPPCCPPAMANLMKKCWSAEPSNRPNSKDMDTVLLNMNISDAEPMTRDEQAQRKERPTGDMLYDLFPKHIADALKAGQKVEPEHHDEVTIFFSDIIHFTDISRVMSPLKVSQMLDRLYLAFDKAARANGVFKVETIGDAYMGVTNLDHTQSTDHVKQAALFAIDLVNEATKILIDEEDPAKGCINIRVGFHSGPVVSNVIGSLNPRYGLFGDSVNTANRMESNSKTNRILCSEASYKLLVEQAPHISVKKRGKIAVKGKGDMIVYWVGDRELKSKERPSVMPPELWIETQEMNRHVDFDVTENDNEAVEMHPASNEKVWRRSLQEELTGMDSDCEDETENNPKAVGPPTTNLFPKEPFERHTSTMKGSVKEATHILRGPNFI